MALTQERLKELLDYDPETGAFVWKVRRKKIPQKPYTQVWIDGRYHLLHRLAWLFVHGETPTLFVDHINCDPTDHRIANLRLATNAQNQANQRAHKDNKIGLKGVRLVGKRYRAVIRENNKAHHLGYFASPEEAHAAYCRAALDRFGEFARAA